MGTQGVKLFSDRQGGVGRFVKEGKLYVFLINVRQG